MEHPLKAAIQEHNADLVAQLDAKGFNWAGLAAIVAKMLQDLMPLLGKQA